MDAADKKILNSYFELLKGLKPRIKLRLIEKLQSSVQTPEKSKLKAAFGAWESSESAEELIEHIRSGRNTRRQIEEL